MRIRCWMTVLSAFLVATPNSARAVPGDAVRATYEAEVIGADVFAFSGPGMNFYPTLMLQPGEIVNVVGPEEKGWVGIEPPRESFSWIKAADVRENGDGTATVTADEAKLWVGSKLSDAHHVHQAVLRKGEAVQPVDEIMLQGGSAMQRWFKVLPARGERRFVLASNLRPVHEGAPVKTNPSIATRPSLPASRTPSFPMGGASMTARVGQPLIPPAEPIQWQESASPVGVNMPVPSKSVTPAAPIKDDPAAPFFARLVSIRQQLMQMRTRLPEQWDLASAEDVIASLSKSAKSEPEKAAVTSLAEIEGQMRQLRDRFETIERRREVFRKQDTELTNMLDRARQSLGGSLRRFDAEGVLRPAEVTIDGQRTFLLEQGSGSPTHYVNFVSGLSGDEYLGQRVGLVGSESRRSHVPIPRLMASQITPLP